MFLVAAVVLLLAAHAFADSVFSVETRSCEEGRVVGAEALEYAIRSLGSGDEPARKVVLRCLADHVELVVVIGGTALSRTFAIDDESVRDAATMAMAANLLVGEGPRKVVVANGRGASDEGERMLPTGATLVALGALNGTLALITGPLGLAGLWPAFYAGIGGAVASTVLLGVGIPIVVSARDKIARRDWLPTTSEQMEQRGLAHRRQGIGLLALGGAFSVLGVVGFATYGGCAATQSCADGAFMWGLVTGPIATVAGVGLLGAGSAVYQRSARELQRSGARDRFSMRLQLGTTVGVSGTF